MINIYTDRSEYAISTWTLENLDLYTALSMIAHKGFNSVEIWANRVHLDPRVNQSTAAVRSWLKTLRLSVHSIHAPFYNAPFSYPTDEAEFNKYRIALMKKTIDSCVELDAIIMVLHAVNRREYNYPMSKLHIVKDFFSEVCDYGRRSGVEIALENIASLAHEPDEIECTLQNQTRLFEGIGLKYCLDIGHTPLTGVEPIDEVEAAGKDLITYHIHNNDGCADLHDLPNSGVLDWPSLRQHIRKTGFSGPFVLEIAGGKHPAEALQAISDLFTETCPQLRI